MKELVIAYLYPEGMREEFLKMNKGTGAYEGLPPNVVKGANEIIRASVKKERGLEYNIEEALIDLYQAIKPYIDLDLKNISQIPQVRVDGGKRVAIGTKDSLEKWNDKRDVKIYLPGGGIEGIVIEPASQFSGYYEIQNIENSVVYVNRDGHKPIKLEHNKSAIVGNERIEITGQNEGIEIIVVDRDEEIGLKTPWEIDREVIEELIRELTPKWGRIPKIR